MHRELKETAFEIIIKIQGKARESMSCKNKVSKTSPVKVILVPIILVLFECEWNAFLFCFLFSSSFWLSYMSWLFVTLILMYAVIVFIVVVFVLFFDCQVDFDVVITDVQRRKLVNFYGVYSAVYKIIIKLRPCGSACQSRPSVIVSVRFRPAWSGWRPQSWLGVTRRLG